MSLNRNEEHFILRVSRNVADEIRRRQADSANSMANDVQIHMDEVPRNSRNRPISSGANNPNENLRRARMIIGGKPFHGRVVDLPCVLETYKQPSPRDVGKYWKLADISEMIVIDEENVFSEDEKRELNGNNQFHSGLTVPSYEIRKRWQIEEDKYLARSRELEQLLLEKFCSQNQEEGEVRIEVVEKEMSLEDFKKLSQIVVYNPETRKPAASPSAPNTTPTASAAAASASAIVPRSAGTISISADHRSSKSATPRKPRATKESRAAKSSSVEQAKFIAAVATADQSAADSSAQSSNVASAPSISTSVSTADSLAAGANAMNKMTPISTTMAPGTTATNSGPAFDGSVSNPAALASLSAPRSQPMQPLNADLGLSRAQASSLASSTSSTYLSSAESFSSLPSVASFGADTSLHPSDSVYSLPSQGVAVSAQPTIGDSGEGSSSVLDASTLKRIEELTHEKQKLQVEMEHAEANYHRKVSGIQVIPNKNLRERKIKEADDDFQQTKAPLADKIAALDAELASLQK